MYTSTEMHRAVKQEWRNLRAEHMGALLGVNLRFSKRMTRTLGSCRFRRVAGGPSVPFEVVISESLLTCGIDQVKDTLRHEAAHALAGHAAGHGPVWKTMARKLGAKPRACGQLSTAQREARQRTTQPRFTIRCARCGLEDVRHRMANRLRFQYQAGNVTHAGRCGGLLTLHDDRS